jgi:hypothetical protein
MSFEIGDTVMTTTGRLYIIRSFFQTARDGEKAYLSPVKPRPSRASTHAGRDTLTLVRSRELSLAFHYAAEHDRDGIEDWQRETARRMAGHWLSRAEHRNDDSRAALCLGSDRVFDLEVRVP